MTEKEVEKAYKKMTESDAPDLWAKIESNLPEKEVRTEKKVRTGFFAKLGKIFSGGSTCAQSASLYMAQLRGQAVCSEQAHLMERLR